MIQSRVITCDDASFARLLELCKTWPRVIAAQQSNILREAQALAVETKPYGSRRRLSIKVGGMGPTDRERLMEMVTLWPELSGKEQRKLVDYALLVAGSPAPAGVE